MPSTYLRKLHLTLNSAAEKSRRVQYMPRKVAMTLVTTGHSAGNTKCRTYLLPSVTCRLCLHFELPAPTSNPHQSSISRPFYRSVNWIRSRLACRRVISLRGRRANFPRSHTRFGWELNSRNRFWRTDPILQIDYGICFFSETNRLLKLIFHFLQVLGYWASRKISRREFRRAWSCDSVKHGVCGRRGRGSGSSWRDGSRHYEERRYEKVSYN